MSPRAHSEFQHFSFLESQRLPHRFFQSCFSRAFASALSSRFPSSADVVESYSRPVVAYGQQSIDGNIARIC